MDMDTSRDILQEKAPEQDMDAIRAAVDDENEKAKEAIQNGTLVPEPEEESQEDTEKGTEHIGDASNGDDPSYKDLQLQKYRNDLLSFMGLSYVSLSARRKSIRDNMEALRQNKQYLDDMRQAAADASDFSAAEIAAMNMGQNADFYEKYDGLMSEGTTLTYMIDQLIAKFPDEKRKSVSFVSNSMVQSCRNQIDQLKTRYTDGSHDNELKRLENIATAYANRQDAGPIMNKLSYGHNVLNHIKMLRDSDPLKVIEDINRYFYEVFKDKDMVKFRALLGRLRMESMLKDIDQDRATELTMVAALFITHWLGYSYNQEKENGRSTYFKTFIMNVYDYYSNDMDFDLPGGKEVFKLTTQLVFACFETGMAIMSDKRTGFRKKVAEYNDTYVKYGAAYSAQIAQFVGSDIDKTGTLVSDFISEQDIDELANAVYDWVVENSRKEDESDDVDSDDEEGDLKESAEEDGDETPGSEAEEDRRLDSDTEGDAGEACAAEELPDSEADSGEAGSEGGVFGQDEAGGLHSDGMAEAPDQSGSNSSDPEVEAGCDNPSREGDAPDDSEEYRGPVPEDEVRVSGPIVGYEPEVQGRNEIRGCEEAAGGSETIPERHHMISDGPQEDIHETVQSELAAGDDTPTIPPSPSPTEKKVPDFPIPPKMTGMPVFEREEPEHPDGPTGKIIN